MDTASILSQCIYARKKLLATRGMPFFDPITKCFYHPCYLQYTRIYFEKYSTLVDYLIVDKMSSIAIPGAVVEDLAFVEHDMVAFQHYAFDDIAVVAVLGADNIADNHKNYFDIVHGAAPYYSFAAGNDHRAKE